MAKKQNVTGTVDRVEGDVAVVVIRDPDDPQASREVYVNKKKLKKADLKLPECSQCGVRADRRPQGSGNSRAIVRPGINR